MFKSFCTLYSDPQFENQQQQQDGAWGRTGVHLTCSDEQELKQKNSLSIKPHRAVHLTLPVPAKDGMGWMLSETGRSQGH